MGLNNNLGKLAEVLTVSGSGNVGLGKEVPNAKLDVVGNTIVTGSLNVTQGITGSLSGTATSASFATTASFTNVAGLGGFVQGGNSFGAQALIGTNDNQSLALETSGSIRMFVSSSGNVGIGLTNPGEKLDVIGNIRAKYAANSSNISFEPDFAQVYLVASSADNTFGDKKLVINSSGLSLRAMGTSTAAMEIASDGKVGIGTTSPSEMLTIDGNILLKSAGGIKFNRTDNAIFTQLYDAGTYFALDNRNGNGFDFQAAGTSQMRITSAGSIGIGTTSPSGKLDIIQANGNGLTSGYSAMHVRQSDTSVSEDVAARITFNADGGTTVYGFIEQRRNSYDSLALGTRNSSGGAGYVSLFTQGTEKMRITGPGNVGIGTVTPTEQLHLSKGGSTYIIVDNTGSDYRTLLGTTGSGTKLYSRVLSTNGAAPMDFVLGSDSAMYINTSRNIGIGTTTPSHRLDVVGAGRFSSNIMARNFNNAIKSWSSNGAYNWATELLALSGFFDSAGWYKGFIRESNGAHYYGYQFDIHVGQLGYGGASNQFIVRNMTYAGGPWVGGCGVSSFASIDNSGFTKQSSGCFDSLELFITRLG